TPPAGVTTEFTWASPCQDQVRYPSGITVGPDGNLWFPSGGDSKIWRVSRAGLISELPLPATISGKPGGVTAGPDGNLWFTEPDGNKIGRMRVPGTVPGDVDGDGTADLVWRHTQTGDVAGWLLDLQSPAPVRQSAVVSGGVPLAWHIVGVGDVDGDGIGDLVWRRTLTGGGGGWLVAGATR